MPENAGASSANTSTPAADGEALPRRTCEVPSREESLATTPSLSLAASFLSQPAITAARASTANAGARLKALKCISKYLLFRMSCRLPSDYECAQGREHGHGRRGRG